MSKYSSDAKHNGTTGGDFCVYPIHDDPEEDNRSLAWFKKTSHPDAPLHFEWNVDYGIVWSETGALEPGIVFQASEVKSADLMDTCFNTCDARAAANMPAALAKPSLDERIPNTEIQEAVHKCLDNTALKAKSSYAR